MWGLGFDGYCGEHADVTVSWIYEQRFSWHHRFTYSDTALPLPHDLLHALHERPDRQGEADSAYDRPRRHAAAPAAEEPHGVDRAEQDRVLYFDIEHHTG